jgi:chromosome partitioning protein
MNFAAPIATDRSAALESAAARGDVSVPSVIVQEAARRARPSAHLIVFANEKGGVGKSTLAFHSAIALAYSGARILAIDLDRRQRSLASTLDIRLGTMKALKLELPGPKHVVLDRQSGAMLYQEIMRLGTGADFIVIDLPGADSATARYAMAIADTLVTPVGNSAFDISGLGKINPVTRQLTGPGHFGELVCELRKERGYYGLPALDWLVLRNRTRATDQRLEAQTGDALDQMAEAMHFRIGSGLAERIGYRDLLTYGLTYLDISRIPGLGKRRIDIEDAIGRLVALLDLPGFADASSVRQNGPRPKVGMSSASAAAFVNSLHNHMSKVVSS